MYLSVATIITLRVKWG